MLSTEFLSRGYGSVPPPLTRKWFDPVYPSDDSAPRHFSDTDASWL
jgi:hypothetical protein